VQIRVVDYDKVLRSSCGRPRQVAVRHNRVGNRHVQLFSRDAGNHGRRGEEDIDPCYGDAKEPKAAAVIDCSSFIYIRDNKLYVQAQKGKKKLSLVLAKLMQTGS
jgi:hypothetical protein